MFETLKPTTGEYSKLADLPFEAGETLAAMSTWSLLGTNCLAVVSTAGRMFVMKIDGQEISLAGPLQFHPKSSYE